MRADNHRENVLSSRMALRAGPAVAMMQTQRALAEEVGRRLEAGSLRRVTAACVCGVPADNTVVANVDRYGLDLRTVLCGACGTLRADPYFDEPSLRAFYRDYYQDLYARATDPEAYFDAQKNYGRRILEAIRRLAPQCRTAVEIGCGAGGALHVLHEAGMATAGCDHSENLIALGTKRGIKRLAVGDIRDLIAVHPDLRGVEVVYLHHVFEHVWDPMLFLQACRDLLSASGVLLAIVPDISRIDAFPFPGGDLRLFLHIAHKFKYSRRGLRMLGARCGYAVEFLEGFESKVAPEMWAVLRPRPQAVKALPAREDETRMLAYLRRTEARYRFGLLPGYQTGYAARARRAAKTLLPSLVVAWLSAARSRLRR